MISGFDFFVKRLMIHVSLQVFFCKTSFHCSSELTSFERRFQARNFRICKIPLYQLDFKCP